MIEYLDINLTYTDIYAEKTNQMIIYIYLTLNKFIEHKPPCNECLVQGMCISEFNPLPDLRLEFCTPHIRIKMCNNLKHFIINNKYFTLKRSKTKKLKG